MESKRKECLTQAGIAVDEAMERFMGNEMLLERFLKKFPEDGNYDKLREALKTGEQEEALKASHTLKGLCGNLSMKELYELFDHQVKAMRAESWQEAEELMGEIENRYQKVCQTIRNLYF